MPSNSLISDYSRYFCLRQKVYLVNMSAERNSEIYESLSGVVISRDMNRVDLKIAYAGAGTYEGEAGNATFKLTSEALGSGIQVLGDLVGIVQDNVFQFRLHGTLEMFQRRIVPRVDLSLRIYQRCGSFPLPFFKKEWKRIMDHLHGGDGALPGLVMEDKEVNLSAGGVGLRVAAVNCPTPLSMFFVSLDADRPVCALAETIWQRNVDDRLCCGFRFIQILKADQERLSLFVSDMLKNKGTASLDYKRNWVLVDKMMSDIRKP